MNERVWDTLIIVTALALIAVCGTVLATALWWLITFLGAA